MACFKVVDHRTKWHAQYRYGQVALYLPAGRLAHSRASPGSCLTDCTIWPSSMVALLMGTGANQIAEGHPTQLRTWVQHAAPSRGNSKEGGRPMPKTKQKQCHLHPQATQPGPQNQHRTYDISVQRALMANFAWACAARTRSRGRMPAIG